MMDKELAEYLEKDEKILKSASESLGIRLIYQCIRCGMEYYNYKDVAQCVLEHKNGKI
mgnify:CR=1 FL=1